MTFKLVTIFDKTFFRQNAKRGHATVSRNRKRAALKQEKWIQYKKEKPQGANVNPRKGEVRKGRAEK